MIVDNRVQMPIIERLFYTIRKIFWENYWKGRSKTRRIKLPVRSEILLDRFIRFWIFCMFQHFIVLFRSKSTNQTLQKAKQSIGPFFERCGRGRRDTFGVNKLEFFLLIVDEMNLTAEYEFRAPSPNCIVSIRLPIWCLASITGTFWNSLTIIIRCRR